ncbi:MAG: hypothetical protein J6N70_14255 [Oribacterium sp.]|nr:hypothetical protein [Oribacterium sp.]
MKFFIREAYQDVEMFIYGMDGEEKTYEFFKRFFEYTPDIYDTTDEERREFNTNGIITICYKKDYELILDVLDHVQQAIDLAAEIMNSHSEIKKSSFIYEEQYFLL